MASVEVKGSFLLHPAFWRVFHFLLVASSNLSFAELCPSQGSFFEMDCSLYGKRSAAFRLELEVAFPVWLLPDLYATAPGMQLGLLCSVGLASQLRVSFPMGIRLDRLSFALPNSA